MHLQYFGGDVSSIVIDEHKKTFDNSPNINFGLVDVVDENLLNYEGVANLIAQTTEDSGVLIVIRQLMQHLSSRECLLVLNNIAEMKRKTPNKVSRLLLGHHIPN